MNRRYELPWIFQGSIKRHGMNVFYDQYNAVRRPVAAMAHTVCPRALQSNDCTPISGRIVPNDTCRQSIFWPVPQRGGSRSRSREHTKPHGALANWHASKSEQVVHMGGAATSRSTRSTGTTTTNTAPPGRCGGSLFPPDGGPAANVTVFPAADAAQA